MTEIDALTLRKTLTQVLDQASAGEVFTITKRGKPMAQLGPPGKVLSATLEETDAPIAEGIKDPDVLTPEEVEQLEPVPAKIRGKQVDSVVLDDWDMPVKPQGVAAHYEPSFYGSVTEKRKPATDDGIKDRPSPWDLKYGKKGKK